ncbi:MAG: hypothetical protein JSV74_02445 [Dehalococcoidia bacterium]|nr:MAG: hypothetical protein JSV74_02445 [Dehalococcoidia bacterium]
MLYRLLAVFAISIICVFTACDKTGLGEEFSVSIGQTIAIMGEDIRITFLEVINDNRCARDVVCVTEGDVVCKMRVVQGDSSYDIELAQPGLYYDYSQRLYGDYFYTFKVTPYPESEKKISVDEYRILLTLNK